MRRRDGLALPDVLFALAALSGAFVGSVYGFTHYGVVGAVLGIPVGFLTGGLAAIATCVALAAVVFGVVVTGAFLKGGRGGVRELFRDPPPAGGAADSTTAGDCHGDG